MNIRCPETNVVLELTKDGLKGPEGRFYPLINGVYRLLSEERKKTVLPFVADFENFRKPYTDELDPQLFKKLPYVSFNLGVWKLRQHDLELIKTLLPKRNSSILEIGGWNGWLSNQLARLGHHVTAVDYFTNELDGLEAKKHYDNSWTCLQMEVEDMNIIEDKFDFIIVNRACGHYVDLEKSMKQLIHLLKPNGQLILTGVNYFRNPIKALEKLNEMKYAFESQSTAPFFFKPFKGVIDKSDIAVLNNLGFKLNLYPQLKIKSFLSRPFLKKPLYYYAIYNH